MIAPLQASDLPVINQVQVNLLSDVSSAAPGSVVHLGFHFKIAPGWHVYYKNPGQSGLATKVSLETQAPVLFGDLEWPVPVAFDSAPGIKSYGYGEELLLWAPVEIGQHLTTGEQIKVDANIKWLACGANICVPGKASLNLILPVGHEQASEQQAIFHKWQSRMTEPAAGHTLVKSHLFSRSGDEALLKVQWTKPLTVQFAVPALLPAGSSTVSEINNETQTGDSLVKLKITGDGTTPLEVLVIVQDEKGSPRGLVFKQ